MYHLFAVNGKVQVCFSIRAKISNLSFYQRFGIQYTIDEIFFSFFLADGTRFEQSMRRSQIQAAIIPAKILNLRYVNELQPGCYRRTVAILFFVVKIFLDLSHQRFSDNLNVRRCLLIKFSNLISRVFLKHSCHEMMIIVLL